MRKLLVIGSICGIALAIFVSCQHETENKYKPDTDVGLSAHLSADYTAYHDFVFHPADVPQEIILPKPRVNWNVPGTVGRADTKRHVAWRCRILKLC